MSIKRLVWFFVEQLFCKTRWMKRGFVCLEDTCSDLVLYVFCLGYFTPYYKSLNNNLFLVSDDRENASKIFLATQLLFEPFGTQSFISFQVSNRFISSSDKNRWSFISNAILISQKKTFLLKCHFLDKQNPLSPFRKICFHNN